jgi:hypothetical protein
VHPGQEEREVQEVEREQEVRLKSPRDLLPVAGPLQHIHCRHFLFHGFRLVLTSDDVIPLEILQWLA